MTESIISQESLNIFENIKKYINENRSLYGSEINAVPQLASMEPNLLEVLIDSTVNKLNSSERSGESDVSKFLSASYRFTRYINILEKILYAIKQYNDMQDTAQFKKLLLLQKYVMSLIELEKQNALTYSQYRPMTREPLGPLFRHT